MTDMTLTEQLNVILANTYTVLMQTQSVHWNIVGSNFYGIHKMTESQYEDMFSAIDQIAERIRAKGYHATSGMKAYSSLSLIEELDDTMLNGDSMCQHLIDANKKLCEHLKLTYEQAEKEKDTATADFINDRILKHEEHIWMLSATISGVD
ncbi:MAG: DNA starvation/stationary phase protection protein [Pseudomonadota bacterium]|nr:DNA starvation/stationary phase protection protein [Pseudomonadota bacterium]